MLHTLPDSSSPAVSAASDAFAPSALQILGYSGVFDATYYLKNNPDLQNLGTAALRHYHQHGWKEGRKPNPFFDPHWYVAQNRDGLG
ncbi:MAG: hypothetical protein ABF542_12795, partial [Gluconobacter sp.]